MDTSIAETYLLLAYDERTGHPAVSATTLHTAFGAAVLLDLIADGVLELRGEGDHVTVHATGREVDDPRLATVVELANNCGLQYAISLQSSVGAKNLCELRDLALTYLAQLGAVRREDDRVFWLFHSTTWKEANPAVEAEGRAALRAAILADPSEDPLLDHRTKALVGLTMHEDLILALLPDVPAETVRIRTEQIVDAEPAGDAVGRAIAEAVSAVTAALLVITVIVPNMMG